VSTHRWSVTAALSIVTVGVLGVLVVFGPEQSSEPIRDEPAEALPDGEGEGDHLDVAREMLAAIYANGDARDVFDLAEPGTLPREPRAQLQLMEQLNALFAQRPFDVVEEEILMVRGVEIARIRVGQVNWCVTPDRRILLGCRVALASASGTTDLRDIDVSTAEVDILVNRVDVAAVLLPVGDESVDLEGHPELESAFVRRSNLAEVDYVMDGHRTRAPADELTLRPEVGLIFVFELVETADLAGVGEATFRYVWPDGDVIVEVDEIVWLVDERLGPRDEQEAGRGGTSSMIATSLTRVRSH
jgi:hypothetical protein